MQRLISDLWILAVCLMCLLVANSDAQIYKWVDENGKTHYSEKKEDAGNAKTEELKSKSQPTSPQKNANSSEEYWREQERQFQERQAARKAFDHPVAKGPRSLSGGKENGTNASRCALARDVLSGAVKHKNGAPIDSYDRQVAEGNVRAFCH